MFNVLIRGIFTPVRM